MNQIKHIRERLGISIYKLAEIASLSPGYISNLENDRRTNPSRESMEQISRALNSSVQTIFFSKSKSNEKKV